MGLATPASPPPLRGARMASKVPQYEAFLNEVLKADLEKAASLKARLQAEVQEWDDLAANLRVLQQASAGRAPTPCARACVCVCGAHAGAGCCMHSLGQSCTLSRTCTCARAHTRACNQLQAGQHDMKALVDVGSEVLCEAHVPDASRLFISIGEAATVVRWRVHASGLGSLHPLRGRHVCAPVGTTIK